MTWVPRLLPTWLFKTFIRMASRNARVAATHGCIAVTDKEIEQIWQAVPDGTPIEIRE